MISNIIEKAKSVLCDGVEFMEGREKADLEMNKVYTIVDFDFLSSSDGDYVVFITKEDDENFYFGGQVLTQKMKELCDILSSREMEEIKYHGIPVKFEERRSEKNRRKYIACEFDL